MLLVYSDKAIDIKSRKMLKKFTVTNFKGFKDSMTLDLSDVKNYAFHEEAINQNEKIVKLALIYGPNGIGKSNLSVAIFDITANLTDNRISSICYEPNYKNANLDASTPVEFEYIFQFNKSIVKYKYGKAEFREILYEELSIDDKTIIKYDRKDKNQERIINLVGTENLNIDFEKIDISLIKYIHANSILDDSPINSVFKTFISFVNRMLEFWSLDRKDFQGLEPAGEKARNIGRDIIKQKHLDDFKKFLKAIGADNNVVSLKNPDGEYDLYYQFEKRNIEFFGNCSSGIRAVSLFYFWLQRIKNSESPVSFVCIDEFDAFYNYSISEAIIKLLLQLNCQVILTTHNTALMTNGLLRPDCYFLMFKDRIKPLSSLIDKELREAHNLEKMYKAGVFDE